MASNPEFLVEGRAYEAFLHPDRIVVGAQDDTTADLMRRLYAPIDAPLVITDIVTAELAKYAANAFLATQISFINEMADLAEAAGADVAAVSNIIKMDRRVGERAYLNPGIGYGGSCLPKDLRALTRTADDLGVEMRLARAVNDVNEARAERVVEKLRSAIGGLDGRRIAVWGLAFKGGTNDVRESPAIAVVRQLIGEGAVIRAFDPLAEPAAAPLVGREVLCATLYEPLDDAEALVDPHRLQGVPYTRLRVDVRAHAPAPYRRRPQHARTRLRAGRGLRLHRRRNRNQRGASGRPRGRGVNAASPRTHQHREARTTT